MDTPMKAAAADWLTTHPQYEPWVNHQEAIWAQALALRAQGFSLSMVYAHLGLLDQDLDTHRPEPQKFGDLDKDLQQHVRDELRNELRTELRNEIKRNITFEDLPPESRRRVIRQAIRQLERQAKH